MVMARARPLVSVTFLTALGTPCAWLPKGKVAGENVTPAANVRVENARHRESDESRGLRISIQFPTGWT